jgi:hypothetical protein
MRRCRGIVVLVDLLDTLTSNVELETMMKTNSSGTNLCKLSGLLGMAVEWVETVEGAEVAMVVGLICTAMEREEDVEPTGLAVEEVRHPGGLMIFLTSMVLLKPRIH